MSIHRHGFNPMDAHKIGINLRDARSLRFAVHRRPMQETYAIGFSIINPILALILSYL